MQPLHVPVLLQEAVEALDLGPGEIFLDGTLGGGGHSREVLRRFPGLVRVIGLDQDLGAVSRGRELGIEVLKSNFRELDEALQKLGLDSVDAVLFDLGISSDQLDASGKGFSFQRDEPLDMRMAADGPTAADILNTFPEESLELIIRGFGEERYSRKIAAEIAKRRERKAFATTSELVEAVESAMPASYLRERIHPATRTFQALRIATNSELEALEEGMRKAFDALKPGGRLVIISFHSLEDRLVKNFFRSKASEGLARLITKKPIVPSEEETERNPRSRSAKLRVIEKI